MLTPNSDCPETRGRADARERMQESECKRRLMGERDKDRTPEQHVDTLHRQPGPLPPARRRPLLQREAPGPNRGAGGGRQTRRRGQRRRQGERGGGKGWKRDSGSLRQAQAGRPGREPLAPTISSAGGRISARRATTRWRRDEF
jgi:hypothetical protein